MLDDLRQALRRLRNHPGTSAAAILALALGIGCTTAIFSVMQAVLLRALPFPEPDRLVSIWEDQPESADSPLSGPDFRDLRSQAHSFEAVSASTGMRIGLTGLEHPQAAIGSETDGEFFAALRASALVGRLYSPGSSGEVVLSERLWRRDEHYLEVIARLCPGVTLAQAQAELDAISSRLSAEYPDTNRGHRMRAAALAARIVGDAREPLLLLLGGVVLVLLIACANVASLQLARAAAGERDLAVRAALGASRGRLVRQMLAESLLLSLLGGAAGFVVSWWGVKALVTLAGPSLPRGSEIGVDAAVLVFAAGLSCAARPPLPGTGRSCATCW